MRNAMLMTLMTIGVGVAADPAKPTLAGEWRIVSVEGEGPAKAMKENVKTISIDAETITAGRPAAYTADPAKLTIDMTIAGGPKPEQGKYVGVYELKGDELKLHFALPGAERPSGFAAKAGTFVISLKRK